MTGIPVRKPGGPLHLCAATGRGYRTACRRTLTGGRLEVPPRWQWHLAWSLDLVCGRCERLRQQARTGAELARLAGW